jgi:ABC-type nitrate/sulfonate/bicarbonate transport system substrate-binding protein
MSISRKLPLLVPLALLALIIAACGDDDESDVPDRSTAPAISSVTPGPPDRVTFMAGFKPQANLPFVGVYVAQELGYFDEANLEVDVKHVSTPGDNFRFLATGEVQFSTADASSLLEKRASDPPLDIVSVALIGQRGQQGFAVLADSDIQTPQDWAGKTAGYKGSQVTPDYLAILAASGVERSSVSELRVGFEPQVLTEGQVDIFPVFVSNEPDTLRRLGYETRVFEAADYGAPTLGLTYVTTGAYATEQPDIVRRFVRAALRGIAYADQNREAAINIVLQYAPQEVREHQAYMLETELEAAKNGAAATRTIGYQTLEQWQALYDFLVLYNGLPGTIDEVSAVFRDEFLSE